MRYESIPLQLQATEAAEYLPCPGQIAAPNRTLPQCRHGWALLCAMGSCQCQHSGLNENSAEPESALRCMDAAG